MVVPVPHRLFLIVAIVLAVLRPLPAAAVQPGPDQTMPRGEWPQQPRPSVVHGFDAPDHDYGPGHRGVDLAGHVGQPVRTALAGSVRFVGRIAGRGIVVVGHGATRTTYQPVTGGPAVGTAVAAGERIGFLEGAGSHCAPAACLHWGWIRGEDTYLNPLLLVGGGPVRLLPLWRHSPAVRSDLADPGRPRAAAGVPDASVPDAYAHWRHRLPWPPWPPWVASVARPRVRSPAVSDRAAARQPGASRVGAQARGWAWR